MIPIASGVGEIWEDTLSPEIARSARRFDDAWGSGPTTPPNPTDYLPDDPILRSAGLLVLLRIDLCRRWERRERTSVEDYRVRFPELVGEGLVALLYEEYCLREEHGECPSATEYNARFPEVAGSFRDVLEIHGLVKQGRSLSSFPPSRDSAALPEAGQTIAGFRLVEELGRGAFARVFRAEERELADRSVAVKVSRKGSREPQTLARLQHTHIVPIYSYRTDPVTRLHLLCMPYLGRVTLARVLEDAALQDVRDGGELARILEDLEPALPAGERRPLTAPFVGRTYARAIAWWGARLAEALQHAHERGVLHRDVKPSNILVSSDGLPMLLDFNLAREPAIDFEQAGDASFGGTIAYMAPEHFEAIAEGNPDLVGPSSDLYSLGLVLVDCLMRGRRPSSPPGRTPQLAEGMRRAAEVHRSQIYRVRDQRPDVPRVLEAVVQRCLAGDPSQRYASASDLAADLQAVADDQPLRHAREPLLSRATDWLRRNRKRLATVLPLLAALSLATGTAVSRRLDSLRRERKVNDAIENGSRALREGRPEAALGLFATAVRLAEQDERLDALHSRAIRDEAVARQTLEAYERADRLFQRGESLRFLLLGFGGSTKEGVQGVEEALAPLAVLTRRDWAELPGVRLLDEKRRTRLSREINELLFLWVVALERARLGDRPSSNQGRRIVDAALRFATPGGPWRSLQRRLAREKPAQETAALDVPDAADLESALGCFQWGLLRDLQGRSEAATAWMKRATQLDESGYWPQFYLGFFLERAGRPQQAMEHYQAAVALRPDAPWARYNRALLHVARGDWEQALHDLTRALATTRKTPFLEAQLELGLVKQALGDTEGARDAYDAVITAAPASRLSRFARFDRAKLDIDTGDVGSAWDELGRLLTEEPDDSTVRIGRGLLALRLGLAEAAENDFSLLLRGPSQRAEELHASRALARLALGRPAEAETDAALAYRLRPSPYHERLWIRTLLACGRVDDLLWLTSPDDLRCLPGTSQSIQSELREAVGRLGAKRGPQETAPAQEHRLRAVLLSALGDPLAEQEASTVVNLAPDSAAAYLVRAQVRRLRGERRTAIADVESGLRCEPENPRLLALRGQLLAETGRPAGALIDLDRAALRGGLGLTHVPRAFALLALARPEAAVEEWSNALADDPENPELYLGRARTLLRLKLWDRALADLEQSIEASGDDPRRLVRNVLTYAACLPQRPNRFSRWLSHVRRAWSAASLMAANR